MGGIDGKSAYPDRLSSSARHPLGAGSTKYGIPDERPLFVMGTSDPPAASRRIHCTSLRYRAGTWYVFLEPRYDAGSWLAQDVQANSVCPESCASHQAFLDITNGGYTTAMDGSHGGIVPVQR